jgi:hypothetical protein
MELDEKYPFGRFERRRGAACEAIVRSSPAKAIGIFQMLVRSSCKGKVMTGYTSSSCLNQIVVRISVRSETNIFSDLTATVTKTCTPYLGSRTPVVSVEKLVKTAASRSSGCNAVTPFVTKLPSE